MAKKSSASSARAARATKRGRHTTSKRKIDYSEIPEASDEQLRTMRRVGRPPAGTAAKHLIAIRIDPDVLNRMRRHAREAGVGYQTLINDVLARYAKRLA